MTEKRFIFNCDSDWWTISDNTTNDGRLWGQDVVDLLNEQHETITDLTENLSVTSNREISKDDLIERLEKENEHLKKEVEEYKEAMKRMMIDMMRG